MTKDITFTLSKDSKASEISLDLLRESQFIHTPTGNRSHITRPVQSWEMIDEVHGILSERGISHELNQIWVQNSEAQQVITREERERFSVEGTPINRWLFNQLVTKFSVGDALSDEYRSSIAISFNKNGIAVAFGENVHVCQNMSIFGNNLMTTYGASKIPYDKMIEVVNHWMEKLPKKQQYNHRIINAMKGIEINDPKMVYEIVGKLYTQSVRQAYGNQSSPFTIGQMSSLVRELDRQMQVDSTVGTLWDVYNMGTNLYKPGEVDLANIYHLSKFWHDFLAEEFLEIKDAVLVEDPELAAPDEFI